MKKLAQNKILAVALVLGLALGSIFSFGATAQITGTRDATTAFIKEVTLMTSAAHSSAGDSGTPIDVAAYNDGNIMINVTAASGTPSMVMTFEVCEDATTSLCGYSHTATSAITGTGKTLIKLTQFGRYVRVSFTLTGGTPSLTFTVKGVFKRV